MYIWLCKHMYTSIPKAILVLKTNLVLVTCEFHLGPVLHVEGDDFKPHEFCGGISIFRAATALRG